MHIYYDNIANDYVDENGNKIEFIGKLDRVNMLVGENNSGKSRFMRKLIEKTESNKSYIYDFKNGKQNENYLREDINYIFWNIKTYETQEKVSDVRKKLQQITNLYEKYKYLYEIVMNSPILKKQEDLMQKIQLNKLSNTLNGTMMKDKKYFYIPILRGIENFEVYFKGKESLENIQMTMNDMKKLNNYTDNAKEIYRNKITSIYNIPKEKVFTAENLYEEVVEILLGEESKREKFHQFEKFISDNFYNGEGFSINPMRNKTCLMVKIKSEPEYEIYNLGDGIKQLIVLLYQIYMHKDEEYLFFIEEPEINLHPGFQRKFMEILLSDEFSKHIYFINTHSNHIIDIINENEDVKLYKFKKLNDKKEIRIVDNDYVTVLNELGIRSSSIFLSNCTIWVEGISDRIYLKKYLELYFKENNKEHLYKENIHYSFVEYAGGNITHWNFEDNPENEEQINVKWLSHNVFLVADNDNTGEKSTSQKHLRKEKFKEVLQDNFYELESREIENLISLEILEKMLAKDNRLNEITRKKYNTERWEKEYKQSILSNSKTYIGEFIEETYNVPKSYKISNGKTIKNKADFANKICREIHSYNDLTEEAKKLTESIVEFIEKNNG